MAQDAELPLWERLTMRLHLLACADCRNFKENSAALRRIMQHYASNDASPASSVSTPTRIGTDSPNDISRPDKHSG